MKKENTQNQSIAYHEEPTKPDPIKILIKSIENLIDHENIPESIKKEFSSKIIEAEKRHKELFELEKKVHIDNCIDIVCTYARP